MNCLLAIEETEKLILQYAVYAAIIVLGVLLLILLKRLTRLPKHTELKTRLQNFSNELESVAEQNPKAADKLKCVPKLIYKLDKLVYTIYTTSQKERDGDLDNLSVMLESARSELVAYKSFKCEDPQRLANASAKIKEASALLDRIIERDKTIGKKNQK